MRSTLAFTLVAAAALMCDLAGAVAQTQTPDAPLRMTAFAVNMSTVGHGGANTVEFDVDRWSTDAERDQLITTFNEKGPNSLLNALQRTKRVGYMRLPNTLGYDLHYARKHPGEDGGEQIIIMTDRRIGFWEARNQPRTIDYPFTLIEVRINGEGEGKMSVATKIAYNKKKQAVELENYASEPVRLQNVRAEAKKSKSQIANSKW
jgi:hypothetical protein